MNGKKVKFKLITRAMRQEPGGKETYGTMLTITYDDYSQSFEWIPDKDKRET